MSCLFDSLSRFVKDDTVDGTSLRQIICNYLSTNPLLMDDNTVDLPTIILIETGLAADNYVSLMRNQSTFGGAIEIRAFTKIYNLNVNVKVVQTGKSIDFIENPEYKWCVLAWTGNHFDAVET